MHHIPIRWVLLSVLAGALPAQSPTITSIQPQGGRQGTDVKVLFTGARIGDTRGVFFYRKGIEVVAIARRNASAVDVTLRIAEDCALGSHPFRLRTTRGVTPLELFFVGHLPQVAEKPPNNVRAQAQKVPLNVTVNGNIAAEDIDWFAVDVPEDTDVTFEIEGCRLGKAAWDPHLAIHDPHGNLVLRADDSAFGRRDPVCTLRGAPAGTYTVEVRDTARGGSASSNYRLHIGTFPRPIGTLPAGGRPGETVELQWLGVDGHRSQQITLPDQRGLQPVFLGDENGRTPTPVWLSVGLPNVVEPQEAEAPVLDFDAPAALNGVLLRPGEVDRYRFKARKGETWVMLVRARRLRSPLDAVLTWSREGNSGENDDSAGHPDSRLQITAPADLTYEVAIRDQLGRGGPDFFYRIEVVKVGSAMSTRTAFRRDAEWVAVPSGGRMMTVVAANNKIDGTRLLLRDLPRGVRAYAGTFSPGTSTIPVVLEADAGTPMGGSLADLGLLHPGRNDVQDARFVDNVTLIRVRNNQPYSTYPVERLPIAVTAPPPFTVDFDPPRVPLVRSSPIELTVRIKRSEDFKGSVRITMPWRPPGVSAGEVTIPADKTEARMPLSASASARIGRWKIAAYGYASINGGILRTSTRLVDLDIVGPWMTAKLAKVRVTRGNKTSVAVALRRTKDFAGAADAEIEAALLGLPRDVTTEAATILPDTEELEFALDVGAKAPPGKHRLLLRLKVPGPDGHLVHYFRGGELRIDKPAPRQGKEKK